MFREPQHADDLGHALHAHKPSLWRDSSSSQLPINETTQVTGKAGAVSQSEKGMHAQKKGLTSSPITAWLTPKEDRNATEAPNGLLTVVRLRFVRLTSTVFALGVAASMLSSPAKKA